MKKKHDEFKNWVEKSTKNLDEKVKKEVKSLQKHGEFNEAYEKASYVYEIIGTTNWTNKPKRIHGFLVEDDLKVLFKIDEDNQELIVKNVLLKDVNDESIIQIDRVIRDEMVYLDLKLSNDVEQIGCFYATYKAKDIPQNPHNVIKVEEDEIVGTVHFSVKNN